MEKGDTIINPKTEKKYTIESLGKHQYVSIRDVKTKELHTITLAALARCFEKIIPTQ